MEMDNNRRCAGSPQYVCSPQFSEEECAMQEVLQMNMMDLRFIHHQFHDICIHLTECESVEEFSSECGYTLREWRVCDVMVRNQPKRLPAKTFFEMYFTEKNVTLRDFMRVLLRMKDRQGKMKELVTALWNAALYGNSQYFRNVHGHSQNN